MFELTEEQKTLRDAVRKFCVKEIAPLAEKLDRKEETPFVHFKKLAAMGYLAPSLPERYGGQGADLLTSALVSIEISRVCPSTVLSIGASVLLCGGTILAAGTEEQKKKYIPLLASGEKIGCWGMTEPDAGSDITALRTTARKDGDFYVLNGSKTFITNAPNADVFIVYAMTDKEAKHNGMSAFILEKGMAGLSVGEPMEKMGMRGSPTGEIFMDEVRVSRDLMLGAENLAFWDALQTFNNERALSPALAVGIMERCLEESIKYANQRVQFGKPISHKQAIQFKIARMYTDLEHARAMLYRLIWMREHDMDIVKEASAAKLFCGEAAVRCALEAIQIHGGYGYTREYHVERFMRDAKLIEIGGGTSEIQQLVIARLLFQQQIEK